MRSALRTVVQARALPSGNKRLFAATPAAICVALLTSSLWGQNQNVFPASGNAGIGTITPNYTLEVKQPGGTPGVNVVNTLAQRATIGFGVTAAVNTGWILGQDLSASGTKDFYFYDVTNNFTRLYIGASGNVGIATTNPQYKLAVNGNIGAQDIIVTNTGWSDYVFCPGYRLRPLSEVNAFIQANHHLPDIPSESEVKEKGVSVGEMQSKLLAKVEELTLHMIQADERNNRLEEQNQELRERLARLEMGAASVTATAAK
jgi:hypothetical protein